MMGSKRSGVVLMLGALQSTACEAPLEPEAMGERPIPCVEGTASCAERVLIGPGVYLPAHSTHSLVAGDADVTRAIIVIHGTNRNGDDYFERVVAAARTTGLEDQTLVVAPTFQTMDDGPAPDEPFWTSGGWKRGHLSSSAGPAPRVSSYDAVDRILSIVTDRTSFPEVDDVVVTGHSAGGQVAHRFAATSRVEDGHAGVHYRYVVANPSTFVYLGPERDGPNGFQVPADGACPEYDDWHYGLENLNSYASASARDSIRARLVRRDVRILLGDADTLSASLDVSCGANLQGRHRFERGQTLIRFMDSLFPDSGHRQMTVPGVGHSSSAIYRSAIGLESLFGS